jgi:two-component system chemotaxis response regulator CheB
MRKIRVLVVDDSAVVRRIVTEILSGDPEVEVVGSAPHGRAALASLPLLEPDLVTLDLEMPEMDGLATLVELRRHNPRLPVIMLSSRTARGAASTLDALAHGASDYVTKPADLGGPDQARARLSEKLIPKVKALAGRTVRSPRVAARAAVVPGRPLALPGPVDVLVIGVSTGGPNALAAILSGLPADFPLPVAVVQHMPAVFTRILAERLSAQSALDVREAEAGALLAAGTVLVAPGDHHLALERAGEELRAVLHQDPPEHSCRPAADVLFRSAAAMCGSRVLGLVLTGMGQDGVRGAQAIRDAGGSVLAQDEASSVVWGMPGAIVHAGLADQVLPLPAIAGELSLRAAVGRRRRGAAASWDGPAAALAPRVGGPG